MTSVLVSQLANLTRVYISITSDRRAYSILSIPFLNALSKNLDPSGLTHLSTLGRRRPSDESVEQHDAVLGHVAAALVAAAPEALAEAHSRSAGDEDRQFAEKVAEGLAALGTMNGAALAGQGEEAANKYLAQVTAGSRLAEVSDIRRMLASPVTSAVKRKIVFALLLGVPGLIQERPRAQKGRRVSASRDEGGSQGRAFLERKRVLDFGDARIAKVLSKLL